MEHRVAQVRDVTRLASGGILEAMKKALWFLGYLWALPVTGLGLLLALPFTRLDSIDGEGIFHFVVRPDGLLGRYMNHFHIAAFAIGAVVTYAQAEGPRDLRLVRHERAHVLQALRWGPLFPLLYGLASLWQFVCGRHPYRDNVFEVQARAAERIGPRTLYLVR